jgi:hypothetical protein
MCIYFTIYYHVYLYNYTYIPYVFVYMCIYFTIIYHVYFIYIYTICVCIYVYIFYHSMTSCMLRKSIEEDSVMMAENVSRNM